MYLEKANFSKPVLEGFYPHPIICKVDNEFYMINSIFAYFPVIEKNPFVLEAYKKEMEKPLFIHLDKK